MMYSVMVLIWKFAWDMPMNNTKRNQYNATNNISLLNNSFLPWKSKHFFFAMTKEQAK